MHRMSLIDYYDRRYQPAKHPGDEHRTTREQYRVQIANLNKFFRELAIRRDEPPRDVTLGDLSDELIVGAMNWQVERGRARPTANKLRRHINAVWASAARELAKQGQALPRPDNAKYREDLADPIALLPDEFSRLLTAIAVLRGSVGPVPACDWWEFFVRLTFNVGGRVSAMRLIPTANLDCARGEVLVPASVQKNRRDQREALLPLTLVAARRLRLAERGVPTLLGDWPYTTATMRRHWSRLLVAAGFYTAVRDVPRSMKFHVLRKTFASQLAAEHGAHLACELCCHSSVNVTRRYLDPRYLRSQRVPDLIRDPVGTAAGGPALTLYQGEAV